MRNKHSYCFLPICRHSPFEINQNCFNRDYLLKWLNSCIVLAFFSANLPPCTIVVTGRTINTLQAQWGACPGAPLYYLDIKPRPPGSGVWPKQVPSTTDPLEYDFTGLDAGSLYTVLLATGPSQLPQSTDTSYTSK